MYTFCHRLSSARNWLLERNIRLGISNLWIYLYWMLDIVEGSGHLHIAHYYLLYSFGRAMYVRPSSSIALCILYVIITALLVIPVLRLFLGDLYPCISGGAHFTSDIMSNRNPESPVSTIHISPDICRSDYLYQNNRPR